MNAAPIDFRTVFGPGRTPPGLTCDGCRKELPYGETVCHSDPEKDTDFCEECFSGDLSMCYKLDLTKTTVMARCAPMAEMVLGTALLSQIFHGPPPNVTASYEMRDQEGESLGTFEAFGPPSGELLSAVMRKCGAVGVERQEPKDSQE
tara:strand:+ start:2976 stop:3419 length:444 start_codon:yes stop_codon:yes gene_type:complete